MFNNNPILYKDLLISLNSKIGKNIIIIFAFIYFVLFLFILSELKGNYDYQNIVRVGRDIFGIAGVLQLIALSAIGYIKGLLSISSEKNKNTFELLVISPITPVKFVIGKFLSNFSFVFLLFILSIPFLSIGLLLGGVSIINVAIYLLFSISYISISVLAGMFISSNSKNIIFSLIYGISLIPIVIFSAIIFFGFFPDMYGINIINEETIAYAIFPITLFDTISDSLKYLNFYGVQIHYLLLHVAFFGLIISFLIHYLVKKYSKYTNEANKEYYFVSTLLLFLALFVFSPMFKDGMFAVLFSFLMINFILYHSNDSYLKPGKTKLTIIYYTVIMLISLAIIFIAHSGVTIRTAIMFILAFALFPALYYFLESYFPKMGKGVKNIYFIVILALLFYIVPLISSNLLGLNYANLNFLIKTSAYNDSILNFECNTATRIKQYGNCQGIQGDSITKYYLLYITVFLLLTGSAYLKNRKTCKDIK